MRLGKLGFLAGLLAPLLSLMALQDRPELVRTEIVTIETALRVPFVSRLPVAGPKGSVFVQAVWEAHGQQKFSVLEITADGEVGRTYDVSSQVSVRPWEVRFTVDSSGSVYCFETWPKEEETGPPVYVFESGAFKEKVILSKSFRPRRMFVTPNRTWIFAGHTPSQSGSTATEDSHGVLYEFRSNGKFLREIEVSDSSSGDEKKPERFEIAMDLDLSHLVGDRDGSFFLVRPGSSPLVLKFDASGQLVAKRQTPPQEGTAVLNALLDDQGRLVLDRAGFRRAGGEASNAPRLLTVLDASNLDTVMEATYAERGGYLFAVRGGEYFFLAHPDPLRLEIHRVRQF